VKVDLGKFGGLAFPYTITINPYNFDPVKGVRLGGTGESYFCTGLSVRDYFAAKAMQAAATNPKGADGFTFEQRAEWAYQQADAMLKAREA
jgi:hypothetical protein